ncbi:flagellar protein [Paenibacillus xerothermodurans]|uniref:Flagellar protein n=1 Tax=Paenibacillus xerothermodurans TaxID=1977292 RepID=A0A2W1NIM4_PAEXE|nr:flagellar protein [Paenibacillus xerothermodurans]PZE19365.1 flagellar protein [Paenibacillus xerothermodurans]
MTLNVDNCPGCGKLYVKNSQGVCIDCIKSIEEQYDKCLEYLREQRNCTITELSAATGVSIKQITKFIREGRISPRNNANLTYFCEVCGSSIREHTMCEPCRTRLTKESLKLQEKLQQEAEHNRIAFNIRDRLKERHK